MLSNRGRRSPTLCFKLDMRYGHVGLVAPTVEVGIWLENERPGAIDGTICEMRY